MPAFRCRTPADQFPFFCFDEMYAPISGTVVPSEIPSFSTLLSLANASTSGSQFPLPTPQQRLMDVQIPSDLTGRMTLDRHQPHRFGLELIREYPPIHCHPSPPPGSYRAC